MAIGAAKHRDFGGGVVCPERDDGSHSAPFPGVLG